MRSPGALAPTLSLLGALALAACGGSETTGGAGGADRSTYPAGPYGTTEGSILANLEFIDTEGMPWSLGQVHADPSRKLMLITTSAGWCTACIEEQPALKERHTTYSGRGLSIVLATFENENFQPADVAYVKRSWKERFDLPFTVVVDPSFKLGAYYDESLTPMNMVVEVETMKILRIMTGFDAAVIDAILDARL